MSIAFGPNTPWLYAGVTGWFDTNGAPMGGSQGSGSTQLPAPRPGGNGSWTAPYWMPTRELVLLLECVAHGGTSFAEADQMLRSIAKPKGASPVSLSIQFNGVTTSVTGFVTSRKRNTDDLTYLQGYAQYEVDIECVDPRRLSTSQTGAADIGASSVSLTLDNTGDETGPLTVSLTGPLTGVTLSNSAGGSLSFYSSATIAADTTVLIDMEARSVYDNDGNNLAYLVSTVDGFFGLAPGNNTITLTNTAWSAGAGWVVSGKSAWL